MNIGRRRAALIASSATRAMALDAACYGCLLQPICQALDKAIAVSPLRPLHSCEANRVVCRMGHRIAAEQLRVLTLCMLEWSSTADWAGKLSM